MNADAIPRWRDVPEEHWETWAAVFLASQEGLNLSVPCPVCGAAALHRYFHLHERKEFQSHGNRFLGRGGLWEWCGRCRAFAHYSAAVPEWWSCDLKVDINNLTPHPDAIEEAMQRVNDE